MLPSLDPSQLSPWKKLQEQRAQWASRSLSALFAEDSQRSVKFSRQHGEILFDFAKNLWDEETLATLEALFEQCDLAEAKKQFFAGAAINATEKRAVMHPALRYFGDRPLYVNGENVMPAVEKVREQMSDFADLIISGNWKGFSGKTIKHIINIGIGGSDLGPQMVYEALRPYHNHLQCHFVSNVDGAHLAECLKPLDPAQCLFIVASKTFTTQETMTNAHSARAWFLRSEASESDIAKHFVAVSTNREKVIEFGIDPTNMFEFWDWVGGRYSVWSAIGLSLTCGLGYKNFEKFLKGAESMDRHFEQAPFRENIPSLMAALGLWYVNFWNAESEAIIPYAQNLQRFPAYFQQGNMESNGKSVNRAGQPLAYASGPIIWGEPGTNGQHAFFQLLHQGTRFIPVDFIGFAQSDYGLEDHQAKLLANLLAQSKALMQGKSREEVEQELAASGLDPAEIEALAPFKVFAGNRPSTTIIAKSLSPENLGALMAAYEHKIFVQGYIWNIYSFDQWGVELGKALASPLLMQLQQGESLAEEERDTKFLLDQIIVWQKD